ncbi:hypothetical protein ACSBR2_007899 [Camellia fascicularis]
MAVDMVNGKIEVHQEITMVVRDLVLLGESLGECRVCFVRRRQNEVANALARFGCSGAGYCAWEAAPLWLMGPLMGDGFGV